MNNPIAKELKKENEYFSNKFDERLYVELRPSHSYTDELEKPSKNDSKMTITFETKTPLVKKMRLRVWGYTSWEYIYLQHDGSLPLKHKTYTLRSVRKVRKRRAYVKHGVWHLGNGQTGGFFPLAAPLAGILAGPVIDNIAAPLIKVVVKKIIGRCAPPRRRRQRRNYKIVYY